MASTRTYNRSFAGGELSPEMYGRIDDAKYQSGAGLMRNFIALPQGAAQNRPGFAYVNSTKNNGIARLIPFTYSTTQTMVIEIGAGYFRFHTQGATLIDSGTGLPYEVANSYAEGDLFDIHYVQSADVMTLVHPNYPPAELKRLGATNWTFTNIDFTPSITPPGSITVTASPGFKTGVTSVDLASPAVLHTQSNHTLSLGDPIYLKNFHAVIGGVDTTLDGFYLVNKVPTDTNGAYILDQLQVMDYDGNILDSSGWDYYAGGGTIQYGSKIYDINNYYVITSLAANGIDESVISDEKSALNNLNVTGSFNTITWGAVTGAARYRVYKKRNGLYGMIGETTTLTFTDNNIAPDMGITPPIYETLFNGANNYPGAVGYVEQRRGFAGTKNQPQNTWLSKTSTETDFSYSLPVKDTDRIAFQIASREASTIRHIIPLTRTLLLTSSTEVQVSPVNSDVITPTTVSAKPQSYVGASNVPPSIINNTVVYTSARGGHVRELGFQWQANGFVTGDLSLRAAHLFDNLTIVDQCYSKAPRPIVWFVSSNGSLLGLTYIPEEQLGAWHHHDTDGVFESITAVAEGVEDRLYAIIRRTVNGSTVRYIERMGSLIIDKNDFSTWFVVDAGSTYNGAPATVISGLTWLEGKTVSILADGAVRDQQVVISGQITLSQPASIVHVGLPIDADLGTLPVTMGIDGFGQGRTKNVNRIWLKVFQSSGVYAGPDLNNLTQYKQRTTEPYGSPPELKSEEIGPILLTPSWQESGQVYIRQSDPLPITVVGMTIEVVLGS